MTKALGDGGEKKLPFNRKKSLTEPDSVVGGHLSQPVGVRTEMGKREGVGRKRISSAMAIYTITREEGVRVIHDVVFAIPNNASSEEIYVDISKAVKEAADNLVDCTRDCPYNVTASPSVNITDLDLGSVCERSVSESDVAEYYESVSFNGAVICVTVCESLHSHSKTCYNKGICKLHRDTGPLCECQTVNSTWYLGNDCRFPIHRTAFYVGLSVTLACLSVTVGALTTYVMINKHKQTRRRDINEKLVNQWINEEFEWCRSNSSTDSYNAGDYTNSSFTYERSDSHREIPGDYRQSVPVYQLTQPSLDTNSFEQSSPFSNYSLSVTQEDFSSNLPMRISRHHIRTCTDA
ncbi:putative cell wall protein DAN4-like [Scophthalmus maximus]|uniref:Putative cell wall protein DAN4-like n=1 Tax=Scophthalmus maximus TaxID=52904 RepID=A0A2U9AW53_SCOMX|nr:putative cell wall protein DAN4-like [Scophthalmus maximus]